MTSTTLDIVIPVYNEELALRDSVQKLYAHVAEHLQDYDTTITIADNASTDGTPMVADQLTREFTNVQYLRLRDKGRGRALRAAWSTSEAEIVAYMDVDLSTDLGHLAELVSPLVERRAELSIGSRLSPGSQVRRSLKREFVSRAYNGILHATLELPCADAQCGFKAARRGPLLDVLSHVENQTWFFDTELLFYSHLAGYLIHEVPVRWVEDSKSSVRIAATAVDNLRAIRRLLRQQAALVHAPESPRAQGRRAAGAGTAPD